MGRITNEALILEGSADTAVFEISIEQILAPSLHPGQIVILDNLNTHIGEKVRQVIEARGCQLLFLPSYSPDLPPIEEAFSKLKAVLRRLGARTLEALQEAIGQALLAITAQDASSVVYALWVSFTRACVIVDVSTSSRRLRSFLEEVRRSCAKMETKTNVCSG